jgi:hypothetical protein
LQLEAHVFKREVLAFLTDDAQKSVLGVFFVDDLFDVFVKNRHK